MIVAATSLVADAIAGTLRLAGATRLVAGVIAVLLLGGCALRPSHRYLVAGVAADLGTTAYGLTVEGDRFREVGNVARNDDDGAALATALAVDLGLLWFRWWAGERWPDWEGWASFDYAAGSVKLFGGLRNLSRIADDPGETARPPG